MISLSAKNTNLPSTFWLNNFSRDELRRIAARHGIERGRDKLNTAINLSMGKTQDGRIAKFKINISIID